MNTKARPASSLRLECSRIVLFGVLLLSAFLSSMVHVSPDAAFSPPASDQTTFHVTSGVPAHSTGAATHR